MMSKTLIIDGNNQCFRAFYKFPKLTSKGGENTALIYGFPQLLRPMLAQFKPDKVIVVFDGGKDKNRKAILPDYKKRDVKLGFDFEDFIDQKNKLMDLLPHLGITVVWKKGYEADDFIFMIARKRKRNGKVIIVSSDKDFHQLIDDNVSIYNAHKGVHLKKNNLRHYFNYSPDECVDFLCLNGDKSDKIPGVPGVGEKTARAFLDSEGSIKAYLKSDSSFKRVDKDKLAEVYGINRPLIDLRLFWRRYLSKEFKVAPVYKRGKFNQKEITIQCLRYDISGFGDQDFIKHFKRLSK